MAATPGGGVAGFASVAAISKTTTFEAPLPTNKNFPSDVVSMPSGPCNGKILLPRAPQQMPPTNPPKWPLGPKKPGRRKLPVLHPYCEKFPCAVVMGGISCFRAESWKHLLALFPDSAIELPPPIAATAMLLAVLNTGT